MEHWVEVSLQIAPKYPELHTHPEVWPVQFPLEAHWFAEHWVELYWHEAPKNPVVQLHPEVCPVQFPSELH